MQHVNLAEIRELVNAAAAPFADSDDLAQRRHDIAQSAYARAVADPGVIHALLDINEVYRHTVHQMREDITVMVQRLDRAELLLNAAIAALTQPGPRPVHTNNAPWS